MLGTPAPASALRVEGLASAATRVALAPLRCCRNSTTLATTPPGGEYIVATSESCPEAHSENLGLIETFLPDRISDVQSDRTNRRFPRYSDTSAQADCRTLFNLRLD